MHCSDAIARKPNVDVASPGDPVPDARAVSLSPRCARFGKLEQSSDWLNALTP